MIEKVILDYLKSNLTVPVYTQQPEAKPARYVLIERTGGQVSDKIYAATVALQSYGPSLYEAALVHENVMAAMEDLRALPRVASVRYDTDYHFPDIGRKAERYQVIYQITYYKEEYNA